MRQRSRHLALARVAAEPSAMLKQISGRASRNANGKLSIGLHKNSAVTIMIQLRFSVLDRLTGFSYSASASAGPF